MKIQATILFVMLFFFSSAQTLDYETKVTIHLDDGTVVDLYGKIKNKSTLRGKNFRFLFKEKSLEAQRAEYHYVPPAGSARLSKRQDETPEFMFLKYTSDEADGRQGGLLHFLVEWGLTPEQEKELEEKLQEKLDNPNAKVMGSVPILPDYDEKSGAFEIISGVLSNTGENGMTQSIVKGGASTEEGGGSVCAATLDKDGAALLESTFTNNSSISDVSVQFRYTFPLQVQAAMGTFTFDQKRYESVEKELSKKYSKDVSPDYREIVLGWFFGTKKAMSYEEMRKVYHFLMDSKVVQCKFVEGPHIPEEKMKIVRDAFFNNFLNSFTTPTSEIPPATLDTLINPGEKIDVRKADKYVMKSNIQIAKNTSSKNEIKLDWRLAVNFPIQITGNLKSWYNEIKHNPKCISSVNISDPFFLRPEVRVILDVNTRKIFEENINHASVMIRKGKKKKSVTFDAETIKKGFVQSITFGKEPGDRSTNYQYKFFWNTGGNVEEDMGWVTTDQPALTLSSPIESRSIKLQGNQADLEEAGIPNVTAEIRYRKFNQEQEIELDLFGQESYTNQKVIFVDKSSRAFAYRLIYHHKEHGDLATEWRQKNNEYIYAGIPQKLLDKNEPFINQMKRYLRKYKDAKGGIKEVLNEFGELQEVFRKEAVN